MKLLSAVSLLTGALLSETAIASGFCGGNDNVNTFHNGDEEFACAGTPNGPMKFAWRTALCFAGNDLPDEFDILVQSGGDTYFSDESNTCSTTTSSAEGSGGPFGDPGLGEWKIVFQCNNNDGNYCQNLFFWDLVDCGCPNGQMVREECVVGIGLEAKDATCTPRPTSKPTPAPTPRPTNRPRPTAGSEPTATAPTRAPTADSTCFSGETTVQVLKDSVVVVPMRELKAGDAVLTKSDKYQPIYAWVHVDHNRVGDFLQIHTSDSGGQVMEISKEHLVYVEGKMGPVRADAIKIGDILVSTESPQKERKVTKIGKTKRPGFYAPLTESGTIAVAGGIVASSYADFQYDASEYVHLAGVKFPLTRADAVHMFMSPLRLLCLGVSSKVCLFHNEDGMNYWAAFGAELVKFTEKKHFLVQIVLYGLVVVVSVIFMTFELLFGAKYGPLFLLVGVFVAYRWYTGGIGSINNKKKVD